MHDAAAKMDCPVDKGMMQRALRENPDKENLYPVQVNSLKELLARQKNLTETTQSVTKELRQQIADSERYDRELQITYFERAIKAATNQMLILIKFFKILAHTYSIIELMSENFREGTGVIPADIKRLILETLDSKLVAISDILTPSHSAANL